MSTPPASERSFAHLHVHTEYSMLDGAARIDELLDAAVRMGMPAIATTDHGYVFGAYEFWSKARKRGIKPIIGVEAYLTPGTHRTDKTRVRFGDDPANKDDVGGGGAYTHMTLLARTTGGMHNLFRMSSLASLEGHYFKPRMDRDLLSRFSGGLIATTGCVGGEVQTKLRVGQYAAAREAAAELRDIFGAGNFYAEVMDHGLPIERQTQRELLRLAKDLGLPLLELPEACDNTLLVAEQCDVSFTEEEGRYMPRFPCPEGESETTWFIKEVERGLAQALPRRHPDRGARAGRLRGRVILPDGLPGLLPRRRRLHQLGQGPRHPGGPGRGSVRVRCAPTRWASPTSTRSQARAAVRALPQPRARLDARLRRRLRRASAGRGHPLRHREVRRGPGRPDRHLRHHQGQAGGQGRRPGAGHPFAIGDRITKAMPPSVMGKDISLAGIFDPKNSRYAEASEFRKALRERPDARRVVDTAKGLEGLKRQWGVHAAGVIMSSEPLLDIIPLMRREQDGAIITQFDYPCARSSA
jgi:DNA polymerase-3 subunit alpha